MKWLLLIFIPLNIYSMEVAGVGRTKKEAIADMVLNYHLRSGSEIHTQSSLYNGELKNSINLYSSGIIQRLSDLKCNFSRIWKCKCDLIITPASTKIDYKINDYQVSSEDYRHINGVWILDLKISINYGEDKKILDLQLIDYSKEAIEAKKNLLIRRRLQHYEESKEHKRLTRLYYNQKQLIFF